MYLDAFLFVKHIHARIDIRPRESFLLQEGYLGSPSLPGRLPITKTEGTPPSRPPKSVTGIRLRLLILKYLAMQSKLVAGPMRSGVGTCCNAATVA